MTKEEKLQSEIVIDFSQQHPELYQMGCLYSTLNRTLSVRDGMKQKAMGLVAGVSDLTYHYDNRLVFIELKQPGRPHKSAHIHKQVEWGANRYLNGAEYYICTSVKGFYDIIHQKEMKVPDVYSMREVKKLLDLKKSTIKF
tara:strand:- start:962 stop:1384 length:423 start_codon:yes stop_codon:yes gene_type:complete